MNIQNLNQEELQQLQALLNKMNPNQPIEKDVDPVDKMIDDIIENFNFDRVQKAMDYLRWKWAGEYVTVEMLKQTARRLLKNAVESRLGDYKDEHWEQGVTCATGGFQATAWCNEDKNKIVALDLKFVLADWDESIED